jgi:uncharacterized membrane protein (UPF0127 family)
MSLFSRRLVLAAAVLSVSMAGCGGAQSSTPATDERPNTTACGPMPGKLKRETLDVMSKGKAHHFSIEIAADDASREYGLMCRPHMTDGHGMLFEFAQPSEQTFWMKNTYIPLDIIYVAADGKIVSIARDAKPYDETPLPSYGAARGVLEINGGLAAKLGIEPGDVIKHPFFAKH